MRDRKMSLIAANKEPTIVHWMVCSNETQNGNSEKYLIENLPELSGVSRALIWGLISHWGWGYNLSRTRMSGYPGYFGKSCRWGWVWWRLWRASSLRKARQSHPYIFHTPDTLPLWRKGSGPPFDSHSKTPFRPIAGARCVLVKRELNTMLL